MKPKTYHMEMQAMQYDGTPDTAFAIEEFTDGRAYVHMSGQLLYENIHSNTNPFRIGYWVVKDVTLNKLDDDSMLCDGEPVFYFCSDEIFKSIFKESG